MKLVKLFHVSFLPDSLILLKVVQISNLFVVAVRQTVLAVIRASTGIIFYMVRQLLFVFDLLVGLFHRDYFLPFYLVY